ncbi:MAG: beta-galactosidase [Armatimonadetes bacterium]|nr:beta-galactosidase [Armatimonadota bacterium]
MALNTRGFFIAMMVLTATAGSVTADLTAEVRRTPSGPRLYVNNRPTAPTMFYVSLWHVPELTEGAQSEIRLAGKNGVSIISFAIWGLPWFKEGESPDFSKHDVDVWVEKALAANPNALLLPRFPTDWPPEWWRKDHSEDEMLFGDGKRNGPASIHSAAWRRDASRQIAILVKHLEEKYGDRIVGYHPCGQTSAEWFFEGMWDGRLASCEGAAREGFRRFLKGKYATVDALRQAWREAGITFEEVVPPSETDRTQSTHNAFRDPAVERKVIDFYEFQNADMAEAVSEMCKAVKEAAPRKLAVAFYGYHFELAGAPRGLQSSGHLGLGRLLKSPYVDILCSPVAYGDRQPGGGGFFMAPVDSVLQSGKLWLVEDDTRTHLSAPDAAPGRCADGRETRGVLARNFSHILTRGAALWWMDLPGQGWFNGEETWQHLGKLKETYQSNLSRFKRFRPEIAVIVDERSCLYTHPSPGVTAPLLDTFRRQWYRIGAPTGIYMLEDLVGGKVPPARMYLFLDTFRLDTNQIAAIKRQVCRKGCTAVWMYAPGIVRGSRLSEQFVSEVTGLKLKSISTGDGSLLLEETHEEFSAEHPHLTPTFAVADDKARVLGRYVQGGEVAVAQKSVGGWNSVYCGTLQLPSRLLRTLARQAGVHIYSDQNDVVAAGNGFVSLHASSDGPKVLRMPHAGRLQEIVSGEAMGPASVFTFEMKRGDTRVFRIIN